MDHCINPRVGAAVLCAGIAVGLAGQTVTAAPEDAPQHRHTSVNLESTGVAVQAFERGGRMARLYGRPMAHGATAQQSADAFLEAEIGLLPVEREDLVPDDRNGIGHVQPVMYLPETDSYKFTAFYYNQVRDGVPVYGGRLILLVRNEPGFPLVLANTDVRDIGNFKAQAAAIGRPMAPGAQGAVLDRFEALKQAGGQAPAIVGSRQIIWSGVDDDLVAPRLAHESIVRNEVDVWRIITDAATGAILHEEHRIHFVDVSGNVSGMATEGIATAECEDEILQPLPYLEIDAGTQMTDTDINGNYAFTGLPQAIITISATLNGIWFEVFDFQISVASESEGANPPLLVDLIFNASNNDEFVRAQVNAYIEANRVRDTAIQANPSFPTLGNTDFPVWTNRTDGFCPSNAWYDTGLESINFCSSAGGSNPNTAWSSVVHHEYGHHLVEKGNGGAQGQYGEGMGDVMSTIILDSNRLGAGWGGNCNAELRNADNNHQYPCDGGAHDCGQLISGCVWDTRNELVSTEPNDYQEILACLAVNAILLHSGETIAPDITIDFLTLDDDDAEILNGTPHYLEIATGFGNHNMDAPELVSIAFSFPNGIPERIAPDGGTTIPVVVDGVLGTPEPGTAVMFFDDGDGAVEIALTENSPNNYDVTFPATECGSQSSFYFEADDTGGFTQEWPVGAPAEQFTVLSAVGSHDAFVDDFESDTGWTVTQFADTGNWERGVPVGGGDRGDPPTDADGSGQCYLTENEDGDTDVDSGTTTLESPSLDASDPNSLVEYWRWFSNEFGGNPDQDVFVVEVSSNGGASWVALETVGPGGDESNGDWFQVHYKVSDFVANTADFRIRFSATDDAANGSVVEAGVDGVKIIVLECEDDTCIGDVDGGGVVDSTDLLAMLAAWGACPGCPEDFNGDDVVDAQDLLLMLGGWGPCP